MEFRLFTKPHSADEMFYHDRPASDHINEPAHRDRLIHTVEVVEKLILDTRLAPESWPNLSVADWGCGNGGFLNELSSRVPGVRMWGYDLSPRALEDAKARYGVNAEFKDITKDDVEVGHVTVLTELLEHMVDPHGLLHRLKRLGADWVVASCPAYEDPIKHYEHHLWCWLAGGFGLMFERCGYRVIRHYVFHPGATQFVVARAK